MLKTLSVCFLLVVSTFGFSQEQYPKLTQIVTDNAKIFTSEQLQLLRTKLTDFETASSNQLVILTINELGQETIEEFANNTFNQNRLGQEGKDNGILILFSKNDREVRIEVGYGLEPYITDAVASRIIRNTMIPRFKDEDYFGGMDAATNQLIDFLKHPTSLEEFMKQAEAEELASWPWWVLIIITLFLSIFILAGGFVFYMGYRLLIEVFRGMLIGKLGVVPGIFKAFATFFPMAFGLVFILMPLFFLSMVFGLNLDFEGLMENTSWAYYILSGFLGVTLFLAYLKILVKGKEDFKLSLIKSDRKYIKKTFSSSGTHSFGSGSSSGSSSSSFSGGGGSSGGGGASGSW